MQYGTSYLYTNVPELSSDVWHKHHIPVVDKVLFAPPLQQRCRELEGEVFPPKKHDSLGIPWKAESSKHTIFLREQAPTHFVVVFLPQLLPSAYIPSHSAQKQPIVVLFPTRIAL